MHQKGQRFPRLYISFKEGIFESGKKILLSANQTHYLKHVLRFSNEQELFVFNGHDGEWRAELIETKKKQAFIILKECLIQQEKREGVSLYFSLVKRQVTERIIRMGTELGVSRFYPIISARTNVHHINLERLQIIASEAAEQCERLDVPTIFDIEPLTVVIARWPKRMKFAICLERSYGEEVSSVKADALVVGPEGGFTNEEIIQIKNCSSAIPLSLGPYILRADTACCAGLSRLNII